MLLDILTFVVGEVSVVFSSSQTTETNHTNHEQYQVSYFKTAFHLLGVLLHFRIRVVVLLNDLLSQYRNPMSQSILVPLQPKI